MGQRFNLFVNLGPRWTDMRPPPPSQSFEIKNISFLNSSKILPLTNAHIQTWGGGGGDIFPYKHFLELLIAPKKPKL